MKIIITCGPSYEPIDEVRRITNFSTGELGCKLSNAFWKAGFEAICLRGVAATYPAPGRVTTREFATNDDLAKTLEAFPTEQEVAVFHTAALCDYRVRTIQDTKGRANHGRKIESRSGELSIHLEPATKLISRLRSWFPQGTLVGWKYELDGSIESVRIKGARQMQENKCDGCVVNGRAYGPGFGFMSTEGTIRHMKSKEELCDFLCGIGEGEKKSGVCVRARRFVRLTLHEHSFEDANDPELDMSRRCRRDLDPDIVFQVHGGT